MYFIRHLRNPAEHLAVAKMRFRGLVYVTTTTIIILIWCKSIDWSSRDVAERACNVHNDRTYEVDGHILKDAEADCEKRGLFEPHFGCCPHQDCPANQFPIHIRSGAANVIPPKICFNNTIIMGGARNNAGSGLNIVLINGETGDILRSNYFNLESVDAVELLAYLKILKPGSIILVASHIDSLKKLTDEIREIFAGLGSTMIRSMIHRDNWVFAGAYGIQTANAFEKLIQNDMNINAYGDWPEMGEIIGCFPRVYN